MQSGIDCPKRGEAHDLVAMARSHLEEIAARSDEFDRLRKLPQDLVLKLAESGLYNVCNPTSFGGQAQSPPTYAEVVETLAQADASVAWCNFIGITSAFSMASSGSAVVQEMLKKPGTVTAGVFAPTGRSRRAKCDGEDGFRVSGRWSWGSGSQNAQWVNGGTLLIDEAGEVEVDQRGRPRHIACILDARDIQYCDTWRVMGLQGTGSTDFEVHDVFVPEARAYDRTADRFGTPSSDPIFSFPNFGMLGIGVASTALGAARAAIDDVCRIARTKTPQGSSSTLIQKSMTAVDVAKAEGTVRAARAYFYDAIDSAWAKSLSGSVGIDDRRNLRLAITHAVHAAKTAVDLMHELAGGTSVYLKSPIQRRFRDIHVMTQHMMVNQSTYELFGNLLLDVPVNTDTL